MRFRIALPALLATLLGPGPLDAQDVTVRVDASTLRELATALGPLTASGRYKLTTGRSWWKITWCDSAYSANAGIPAFTIDSAGIHASGSGSASWCNLTVPISFQAHGDVAQDGLRAISVDFTSATVSLRFHVPIYGWVTLASFDASSSVNIPDIPIETALFHFETARGPRRLRVSPRSFEIVKGNGFRELRSNVELW